jgi:hypothetical protein
MPEKVGGFPVIPDRIQLLDELPRPPTHPKFIESPTEAGKAGSIYCVQYHFPPPALAKIVARQIARIGCSVARLTYSELIVAYDERSRRV